MKTVHEKIGEIIRAKREEKGITQLELAKELGYSTSQFVSLFERGLSKVPVDVLGKLSVKLSIPRNKMLAPILEDFKRQTNIRFEKGFKNETN